MKKLILAALAIASAGSVVGPAHAGWALAVSQDGDKHWSYGSSWNAEDLASAKRRALSNCETRGMNCKIVLDGTDGCVALAVGINDNAWHASQAQSRLGAAQTALAECVKQSAGDCEIRHSFCDE